MRLSGYFLILCSVFRSKLDIVGNNLVLVSFICSRLDLVGYVLTLMFYVVGWTWQAIFLFKCPLK